jgi:CRISPR system Cascade subunit CasE
LETRSDGAIVELLVQSSVEPRVSSLPAGFLVADETAASSTSLDPLLARLQSGAVFRFRLRANPTRKIDTKSGPDGARRNGKRVPLRDEDGRASWLRRHLETAGMQLAADDDGNFWLRQRPDGLARGRRKGTATLTHEGYVFEGVVTVVQPEPARQAVIAGIGPARAYGFGLLSLAPL